VSPHNQHWQPSILDALRKTRNGEESSREETEHLVAGHASREIGDHQAAAPAPQAPLLRRVIQD
jgi:thymidine phosphorylase